jgi:hypothetical protein
VGVTKLRGRQELFFEEDDIFGDGCLVEGRNEDLVVARDSVVTKEDTGV